MNNGSIKNKIKAKEMSFRIIIFKISNKMLNLKILWKMINLTKRTFKLMI